jgi:AbrB family looped-hinge helix DNA binding protein
MKEKSKVTSKYQITIPKKIRKKYLIRVGDEVLFMPEKNGIKLVAVKKIENPVAILDGLLEGYEISDLKKKAAGKLLKRKLGL